MKAIIFILIPFLIFSCKRCPPSAVDPELHILYFSIIDKDGIDLFFGENSIYDPYNVKIIVGQEQEELSQDNNLFINDSAECFNLWLNGGKTSIFYVEFIPNRIDTIKVESCFLKWYEETKGCRQWGIYKNDVFFNNIPICTDCFYHTTYKIEIK